MSVLDYCELLNMFITTIGVISVLIGCGFFDTIRYSYSRGDCKVAFLFVFLGVLLIIISVCGFVNMENTIK